MTLDEFGIPHGIYKMRARFAWYLKGLPGVSIIRARINRFRSVEEIKEIISNYADELRDKMEINKTSDEIICTQSD